MYSSILSHPDLIQLGESVTQLLVQQAQSFVLMYRAVESVQRRLAKSKELLKLRMTRAHPVLSRIGPWMRAQLRQHQQRFVTDNQWSAHDEALALCTAERLHQTTYFLSRDLAFMKEVCILIQYS